MKTIDGIILKQMIISASNNLYNHYPEVDELNVFPVPDGDTGTNMNLTLQSGSNMVCENNTKDIFAVSKAFKSGLLLGARGNSGVILSQIFRGFSEGLRDKVVANALDIADAFTKGKEVAYKNVLQPVEGTMLTVIREASDALQEQVTEKMDIREVFEIFLNECKKSLQHTPELLPVLKDAGVVDSGGAGLCKIIEGMYLALQNKIVQKIMPEVVTGNYNNESLGSSTNVQSKFEHKEFGYCTEFVLRLATEEQINKGEKKAYDKKRVDRNLNAHGNSIVSVQDDDLVKVHIHTLNPGYILTYAQQFGEFVKLKIENMTEQHTSLVNQSGQNASNGSIKVNNVLSKKKQHKKYGLITVCSGSGLESIFTDCGVDIIVSGGQTMNPSTDDFVKACKELDCDHIFIFPNNGNIVMAAQQASEVLKDEKDVIVIPTKSIPVGLSCVQLFNSNAEVDDIKAEMQEVLDNVVSGEVTFAVRDTVIDGVNVHKGDFIGIAKKKLVCSVKTKEECLKELLNKLTEDKQDIITIYLGEGCSETKELKDIVAEYEDKGFEVSVYEGNQPVYSYLVAVE